MNGEIQYKVLWVDDDDKIVDGTQVDADEHDLILDWHPNWDDAERALRNDFEGYSAIILDVFCKVDALSSNEGGFIGKILPTMSQIFGEKQKYIPWYFLSAGTMGDFERVREEAEYTRSKHDPGNEWGRMYYKKIVEVENDPQSSKELFKRIRDIAEKQPDNVTLFRHKDVFSLVGEGKLIDAPYARKVMLDIFAKLYYPGKDNNFTYDGHLLRPVLDSFFMAAKKFGLLGDGYIKGKFVSLGPAFSFMADGAEYKEKMDKTHTQYYSEKIFPTLIKHEVKSILEYVQTKSHEKDIRAEEDKEELFGHLFLLCHVIKWLDSYIKEHPDPDENRKKIVSGDKNTLGTNGNKAKEEKNRDLEFIKHTAETIIGREFLVISEKNGLCAGSCRLSPECESAVKVGTKVTIDEVKENTDKDKKRYLFIATKITPLGD